MSIFTEIGGIVSQFVYWFQDFINFLYDIFSYLPSQIRRLSSVFPSSLVVVLLSILSILIILKILGR
jgi:hypothetical protein